MQVLYAQLWIKCSRAVQAFVIMHLLASGDAAGGTGMDEQYDMDEPWCVLLLTDVESEDQVLQEVQMRCECVQRLKQCQVHRLPFYWNQEGQQSATLVASF